MTILEVNVLTGEEIQRNATANELKLIKADEAKRLADIVDANAKTEARNALLERLGITAEEAALLLG